MLDSFHHFVHFFFLFQDIFHFTFFLFQRFGQRRVFLFLFVHRCFGFFLTRFNRIERFHALTRMPVQGPYSFDRGSHGRNALFVFFHRRHTFLFGTFNFFVQSFDVHTGFRNVRFGRLQLRRKVFANRFGPFQIVATDVHDGLLQFFHTSFQPNRVGMGRFVNFRFFLKQRCQFFDFHLFLRTDLNRGS